MMKRFLLFLVVFVPMIISAQKPFELDGGKDVIAVDSVAIRIAISEKNVEITVGKQMNKGSYSVLFEGDDYFVLDCRMEGQLAGERIVVYKRGKKISREGLYPQPNAFLFKVKN